MMESDQDICDWETKYDEQCELTNKIITKYNSLKLDENILTTKLKGMEEQNQCLLIELRSHKTEIDEKNDLIKKLSTNLKSTEEENCNLHRKINEFSRFEVDSKCTTTGILGDSTKQVEKILKLEQDELSAKCNVVCGKLYETKIAFHEFKNTIYGSIFNIENMLDIIKQFTEAEKCKHKLTNQNQKLKDMNCMADEELSRKNKKIKELQRENEYIVSKISKQKKQLQELKSEKCSLPKKNCEQAKRKNNCLCMQNT